VADLGRSAKMKIVLPFIAILSVLAGCSKSKSARIDLSRYSEADIITASGAVIHLKSSLDRRADFVSFEAPQERTYIEFWTDQHKLKGWDINEVQDDKLHVQVYAVESLLPKARISCRMKDGVATDVKSELLSWTVAEKK
jgi:hypothetical protein